jgi:hypothetical protein
MDSHKETTKTEEEKEVMDVFVVPIKRAENYPHHETLKATITELIQDRPINKRSQESSDELGIRNTFNSVDESLFSVQDIDPIAALEIELFENWCTAKLDEFLSDTLQFVNPSGGIVTDCWVNEAIRDNAYQDWHIHSNSILSATYYLNYDPSRHEPLTFISPIWQASTTWSLDLDTIEFNKYNAKRYMPEYNEGDLLMWCSYLKHGFGGKRFNKGRISISMNYMPKTIQSTLYSFDILPGRLK